MKNIVQIFAVILLFQQCLSQPVDETVVSVYTTHSTTTGTNPPLDVYHQIANNLAERITSPIYRFLGINSTKPEATTKGLDNIELLDDQDLTNKQDVKPVDNDISRSRDVEELSLEGIRTKNEKKPEKITLYSSYLPILAKASQGSASDKQIEAKNDTWNELDDSLNWDIEDTPPKPRDGPFVYFLEFFGSMIQLIWGGLVSLFSPSSSSGKGE